ncbi:MAG: hypothetical protein BGO43_00775 [Gammaproteobacteria bacterium 39-13]|nr:hypothetical protein [Gammaproteobacteria bacterium]OJV96789.1 MAG: hypothetical protein BGO43_00775 [Gammaproteobacteria bacterium 39-13]
MPGTNSKMTTEETKFNELQIRYFEQYIRALQMNRPHEASVIRKMFRDEGSEKQLDKYLATRHELSKMRKDHQTVTFLSQDFSQRENERKIKLQALKAEQQRLIQARQERGMEKEKLIEHLRQQRKTLEAQRKEIEKKYKDNNTVGYPQVHSQQAPFTVAYQRQRTQDNYLGFKELEQMNHPSFEMEQITNRMASLK